MRPPKKEASTLSESVQLEILGTGTSTGVPIPSCPCTVCRSENPKNKRLRSSAFFSFGQGNNVLIDTSPDLRQQALRSNLSRVSAVLYTHTHADHTFGIDDLRSFNFIQKETIPLYATEESAEQLKRTFRYCFYRDPSYQGGAPPRLSLSTILPNQELDLGFGKLQAIPVRHGQMEVLGFRAGNIAYVTDCSFIPPESMELLLGLDVLVLDGLRERAHATHFTIPQAVEIIEKLKPKRAYLTHISHEVDHDEWNQKLTELSSQRIELAYDGLIIKEDS